MFLNRRNIEHILAGDLDRARAAFDDAKAHYKTISAEVRSAVPDPEAAHKIEQASNAFRATMDAYAAVLREFNLFLVNGTVPDRLKEPEQESSGPAEQLGS